ncbi:MAG: beta-N-acetylhexosaminidase [Acidobacteriaceae bacterium]
MSRFCLATICSLAIVAGGLISQPAYAQASIPSGSAMSHDQLMPQPASLHLGDGAFQITSALTVSLPRTRSGRLQRAVLRALRRLEDQTGVPLPRTIETTGPGTLIVSVASDGVPVQSLDEDESYSLTVTQSSIELDAPTTVGAIHGLETLIQLAQPSGHGYIIPALTIQDAPRFRWRGLMIDCGRHFEPLDVLERNIDGMAALKLNVFHWHLTEDQSFRIESKVFPRLTADGSDGRFYTQDQARELVRYARDRGIRVVPEFEMPGHSTAWLAAYPELASGSQPTGIRPEFGVSNYALDPTRQQTYDFIEKFLREMTTIFPDQYVHIGGDETPAPDWKTNPRIRAFMKAHGLRNNAALQAYFNQRVLAILTQLHRRMVGWDEILNPALPKDVVVQSWRGVASLAAGARQGYQGVLSAPYYLDQMQPASIPYLADPIPADTTLTPSQQKLILGGEICMWGEHVDARTIDSRIWPRSAAIAERFWSPQNVRDVNDMYRRLQPASVELETLGLQHLTSEDAGLRDLLGSENIAALRTFAQAFEPVRFGERYREQNTSTLTPLTSFVDAVRPDPPIRHQLKLAAQTLLAAPTSTSPATEAARKTLNDFFAQQIAAAPQVLIQMQDAPRLQAVQLRAEQLHDLATVGRQAVQYLSTGTPPPAGWKTASLAKLNQAKKPSAIVRFQFLPMLAELVNANP